MIITILFPELIVIHAIFEFAMALRALRLKEQNGKLVERPWWFHRPSLSALGKQLSHLLKRISYFKHQKAADSEVQSVDSDRKWTLAHCYFANMGGIYYEEGGQQLFPLTALQMAEESGFESPEITEEEIADKSKRDWFAKTVAALGFLQLALSLIVRTNQGLAFSQLETITLGFAVCGIVIYLLYLYKPQKVGTGISLKRLDVSLRFKKTYDSFWDILVNESTHASADNKSPSSVVPYRIPNDNIMMTESRVAHSSVLLLAFSSGLFGAMHAIAWHFEFPSTVEKILWQTATVIAAASPVVGLITIPFAQLTVAGGDPYLFARNCLRLMREYSWHVSDKGPVEESYRELEEVLAELKKPKSYATIFSPTRDGGRLVSDLLEFLEAQGRFSHLDTTEQTDLHRDSEFIKNFQTLDRVIRGEASKKMIESDRTDAFPQKNLLPPAFNLGVLYTTGFLYLLSRVSLLAVGLSSLRQMPDSVYVSTPWTGYIPTLGSSR